MSRKGGGNGSATIRGVRFQESVGTLFAAWLLSGRVIDRRLGLGNAMVSSLAGETDSPVDDLLIATSEGGYVAVQAKTGLSLSPRRGSRFHDTIKQFVNHWIAGARGDGALGWDRSVDPAIDRLVVAVDAKTPLTVRRDLPAALQHLREPGSAALAADKQHALDVFRTCTEDAWSDVTGEPPHQGFAAKLAQVVEVFELDPSDRERMELILESALAERTKAAAVLAALETTMVDIMADRGRVDEAGLRRRLMSKGVVLAPPRHIANDVCTLRRHSASTAEQLRLYEQMVLGSDGIVSMPRECQSYIEDAARTGSLLIVGEAGIGKSAVLNVLARNLREGGDVVQLAVDRHSVQTLEGLGRELGLEHDLVEVLKAWDGPGPGWLVIDGLDAARGSDTEGVFRVLIRRTFELGLRWQVVASIRTFDLQMGLELRRLFEGIAPVPELAEARFAAVRHISVPAWTKAEFAKLLEQASALGRALKNALRELVELARVPFNTNLIGELLQHGVDTVRLKEVSSQAQLLRLYWEQRIGGYGAPAQVCVFKTVEAMVQTRALRTPRHVVDFAQPQVFDDLSSVGVLIADPDDVWVQFRHHVLFDFAAARWLLTRDPIGGQPELRKESANGLLLAPAMRFGMQDLWERDATRERFWTATESMLTDESLDPVIRIAVARMAADLPRTREDLVPLVKRIAGGSKEAAGALQRTAEALVIAMEDEPKRCVEPWVAMLSKLAPHVGQVANVFRFLLFRFIECADDIGLRVEAGLAARALLEHALGAGDDGSLLARPAIEFVAKTYDTDADASRRLLRAVFEETRFERFGPEEIPAVCAAAKAVMTSDPEFVAQIYRRTYGRDITDDRETSMSSSQILSLRSTAQQDYGMARYQLEALFEEFLVSHPRQAVRAVEDAVEGYLVRKGPIPETATTYAFVVGGREVRLREDLSYLWAHDPEGSYADDAPALIVKLLGTLKSCDEDVAIEIAENLVRESSLAVLWSRVFAAAGERGDGLLDFMLPYALEGPFLTVGETRKDAVDVIAKGYERLPVEGREGFERRALSLKFERYGETAGRAKQECLATVFGVIGRAGLATDEARQVLTGGGGMPNERPFRIVTKWGGVPESHEAAATDVSGPDGVGAEAAVREAEEAMRRGIDDGQPCSGFFDEVCSLLEDVERNMRGERVDVEIVRRGEGAIGQGCLAICKRNLIPTTKDKPRTERFVRLLGVACASRWPVVEADTEMRYEESPSWGSPAARVEVAEALLRTLAARRDLHAQLSGDLDQLLADAHPAVRMHAMMNLGLIKNVDPVGFGERLSERIRCETNAAVLRYISGTVLRGTVSVDAALAESLVLELLGKATGVSESVKRLRSSLAVNLTILAIWHQRSEAITVVEGWIADCAVHDQELDQVLSVVGEGYTLGLWKGGADQDEALRYRCQHLASRIAEAAAADFTARAARSAMSDAEAALVQQSAQLLDRVCGGIHTSVVGRKGRDGSGEPPDPRLARFLTEVSAMLMCLAGAGTPSTVYRLLETLDYLMPLDPGKVFDIAMHAALVGGKRTGFQFEPMGADRLVGIVGRLLADYRQVLDVEERRLTLVQCLELFASAGWPSASRLLYRLPELLR